MKKISILLVMISMLFGVNESLAQMTKSSIKEPIEKLRVIAKHTGHNQLNNPKKAIESNDTMFVTLAFRVLDWNKASKIYLKLGDKTQEDKKASLIIDPRKPRYGLPKDVSYSIQKHTMYITLGPRLEMNRYMASIVAEDKQGKKSKTLKVEK